jgi:hypothetical protein
MVELGNKIKNNLWIIDFEWPSRCMYSTNGGQCTGNPNTADLILVWDVVWKRQLEML